MRTAIEHLRPAEPLPRDKSLMALPVLAVLVRAGIAAFQASGSVPGPKASSALYPSPACVMDLWFTPTDISPDC
jgi:hypothetical protein